MNSYQTIIAKLRQADFSRVEKDDRLLDIFPAESRAKGIELWEKWRGDKIYIVRIHVDKLQANPPRFCLSKKAIITSLRENKTLTLNSYS